MFPYEIIEQVGISKIQHSQPKGTEPKMQGAS